MKNVEIQPSKIYRTGKNDSKREIYSDRSLFKETRKNLKSNNNFPSKATQKRRTEHKGRRKKKIKDQSKNRIETKKKKRKDKQEL